MVYTLHLVTHLHIVLYSVNAYILTILQHILGTLVEGVITLFRFTEGKQGKCWLHATGSK